MAAGRPAGPRPTPPHLLENLPHNIWNLSIWCTLPTEARAALRLACRPTQHLTDQLISSATFDLSHPQASNANAADDDDDGDAADAAADAAWADWERGAEKRFAFLSRLPGLMRLHMHDWARETDLVRWLLRCGAASEGRMTALSLDGGRLSLAGGMAVHACCPRLRQLSLGCRDFGDGDGAAQCMLMQDVFLHLRQSPMTTLWVGFGCRLQNGTMPSLGGLTNLLSLTMDTGVTAYQLHSLTGLVSLEHCALTHHPICDTVKSALSFVDVAALFSLARLTSLRLAPLRSLATKGQDPSSVADGDWRGANVRLAGLSRLRSLDLGRRFRVDDALLEALSSLTQLTALTAAGVVVRSPRRGCLPHLRALRFSAPLRPSALLLSLGPLLPLTHLAEFGHCEVDVSCCPGAQDSEREAVALHAVARLLAAAPQLRLPHLSFSHFRRNADDGQHLRVRAIAFALQPLAKSVLRISFEGMDLEGGALGEGTPWALVNCLLPSLVHLALTACTLRDADLVAIAVLLPRLRALSMRTCSGVTDGGWPLFCVARTAPLQLYVSPRLPNNVANEGAQVKECAVVWL